MKGQAKRAKAQKRKKHIMDKTTLGKIIGAVRDLEIRKSKNDSQFEFYNKKKRRIEHKSTIMRYELNNLWNKMLYSNSDETKKDKINYYKQNKETLDFCYSFMDKIENKNKVINNQIKQYLVNYVLTVLVEKLNKLKTFNYKKLDKIFDEISNETNKIHDLSNYYVLYKYESSICLHLDNYKTDIIYNYVKYFESHLTKKTITKKFDIDDFKEFISWDIKTPEQEAQDNATIESDLNALKSKIEKLISDYNQECKKLTINQKNYKYMYVRQD